MDARKKIYLRLIQQQNRKKEAMHTMHTWRMPPAAISRAGRLSALVLIAILIVIMMTDGYLLAAPFAYITNGADDTITVVDVATNNTVTTFPAGGTPYGVATARDGSRVYVSVSSDYVILGRYAISVIDPLTQAAVATIDIEKEPAGIALNPSGTRLYVANPDDNAVTIVDTEQLKAVATVPVGIRPRGVAVRPNNARAYATNSGSDTVSVIDLTTRSVVATVPVGDEPWGIAVLPSGGRAYVANFFGESVSVIDLQTNTVTATIPTEGLPFAIACHPDSKKVYVGTSRGAIAVIDTATNTVAAIINVAERSDRINGLSLTSDGLRLYAAVAMTNKLVAVDTTSNTLITTITVGNDPVSLGQFITPNPEGEAGQTTATTLAFDSRAAAVESETTTGRVAVVPQDDWEGVSPAETPHGLRLSANTQTAVPGNTFSLIYEVTPSTVTGPVDLYLALTIPGDDTLYFLGQTGPFSIPVYRSGFVVTENEGGAVLPGFSLPSALPFGEYAFYAVLVRSGNSLWDFNDWASNLAFARLSFAALSPAQQPMAESLGTPSHFVKTFERSGGEVRIDETWGYAAQGKTASFVNGAFTGEHGLTESNPSAQPSRYSPQTYFFDMTARQIEALHGPPSSITEGAAPSSTFSASFPADKAYVYNGLLIGFREDMLVWVIAGN
jgi:YVTN family beta-propeller protein